MTLDTLTRELTKVHPRPKSEVRAMIEKYVVIETELAYLKGRRDMASEALMFLENRSITHKIK